MKYNIKALCLMLGVMLCFQPQLSSYSQGEGTKETIKKAVDSVKVIAMLNAADSVNNVADSIAAGNNEFVSRLENNAKNLPTQLKSLKNNVDKLIKRPADIDTVRLVKYIPVPELVSKETYWQRQREYTDSLAKAKKDSANWAHRGIFKKIFGPKKQNHEKN